MKIVTVYLFEQAFSSVVTGLVDLFSLVGVTWNRIQQEPPAPCFRVQLASQQGGQVRCLNNLLLESDLRLDQVTQSDLLFIPPVGGPLERTLQREAEALESIRRLHDAGCQIASSCTGTFLLAASGLLDGRRATTHWGYVDSFRQRFPDVELIPEQLITNETSLFTAGGGSAWLDLALFLIELHLGHEIAVETAKALVIERRQHSQVPYSTLRGQKMHQDAAILRAQEWMEQNLTGRIQIDQLGEAYGMSPRTFKRRFRQATGSTPIQYLQSLRVENAKKLLESTPWGITRITQAVGYNDESSFMKLFKRTTGVTPQQYRRTFSLEYTG